MTIQLAFLYIVSVALPIAWLVAEFRAKPRIRRVFGVAAILWSFGVATLVGSLQELNANAYFTLASEKLLQASVLQLQAGHTDVVIREWTRASERFGHTYESRGHYSEIIDDAVKGMGQP